MINPETRDRIRAHVDHLLTALGERVGPKLVDLLVAAGLAELLYTFGEALASPAPPLRVSGVFRAPTVVPDWTADKTPAEPLVAKLRPFSGDE